MTTFDILEEHMVADPSLGVYETEAPVIAERLMRMLHLTEKKELAALLEFSIEYLNQLITHNWSQTLINRVIELSIPVSIDALICKNTRDRISMERLSPIAELLNPVVFLSNNEMFTWAHTLNASLHENAGVIAYFVHIAGKLCRVSGSRLFYLQTPYSKESEDALCEYNFKPFHGRKNTYLATNNYQGSMLIVHFQEDTTVYDNNNSSEGEIAC